MNDDHCPICGGETEDVRHVDVECFYKVNERAPHLYERPMLVRVPEGPTYLGQLYRYHGGEEQVFDTEQTGPQEYKSTSRWEPLADPDALFLQKTMYGIKCCKRCRADFIGLFLRWSRGGYVTPTASPEDGERNIPVRVNGATVMLTRDEWNARQAEREATDVRR